MASVAVGEDWWRFMVTGSVYQGAVAVTSSGLEVSLSSSSPVATSVEPKEETCQLYCKGWRHFCHCTCSPDVAQVLAA